MDQYIRIRGARQHNLKNVDIDIPKNKLVVFTGVSGSGKSSLAFDTIYAEGQRRYVESLSTYARQFLGIMEKPDADLIEGLSPAISIDQKTVSHNPRSTVGTVTEIYDYLRLLYARVGHPHCPVCGREISSQSLDEIVNKINSLIEDTLKLNHKIRFLIMSPVVIGKKGEYSHLFDNLKEKGISYVRIDSEVKNLSDDFVLIKTNKHSIDAILDRLSFSVKDLKDRLFRDNLRGRLTDSVEKALKLSDGLVITSIIKDKTLDLPDFPKELEDHLFSERFACPVDNIELPEIEPRSFSFNSPLGACPECNGIGKIMKVNPDSIFSEEISITEGGILPFANTFEHDTWYSRLLLTFCSQNGIDPKIPIKYLTGDQKSMILTGTGERLYKVDGTNRQNRFTSIHETFTGVIPELERRHSETDSDWVRNEIEKYMREIVCTSCNGTRLKKESLAITINSDSIHAVTSRSIQETKNWVQSLLGTSTPLNSKESQIAKLVLKEIGDRLDFLISVGLEYLTLARPAYTLSGGEGQRIRLASQIGSGLTGVLYVLDEPTIGLHQRDNAKLISTLKKLKNIGNTVIVVEHDTQTIKNSDYVIDFGPGAGKHGGEVVAKGTPSDIIKNPKSLTGLFISGKKIIDIPTIPVNQLLNSQPINQNQKLTIFGCSQFNLKNLDVTFPLSKLTVITGVSGSGKSTLLVETVYPALEKEFNSRFRGNVGQFKRIEGLEYLDKVILIDQSPIGRTPRSNPATYTKVFDPIRDVFSSTREAKLYGYKKGRFSFNVKGGRCEACEGQGQTKIEMQFMSDIWVNCEVCSGSRYNSHTLEVNFRGKNISEVLNLTVDEAIEFFHGYPPILSKLETLQNVGLGYMELGQSSTTLSGGEAQRVKLATELCKKETGRTLYILDEPTTGLHPYDVDKLLKVLKILVSKGNSVVVIEHNLDVIANADWIIDLGPEGGNLGGYIVAQGDIDTIRKSPKSFTGQSLSALSKP